MRRRARRPPSIHMLALGSTVLLSACAGPPAGETGESEPEVASTATMLSESEAYERFMGRWSRRLAPTFLEFVGPMSGDAVLDVGSGTGALAEAVLAQSLSTRVVGIDPSTGYVAYARSRTNDDRASFEEGDGQDLRFSDDSFDSTLSLLVINFIPDPRQALSEMIRGRRARPVR